MAFGGRLTSSLFKSRGHLSCTSLRCFIKTPQVAGGVSTCVSGQLGQSYHTSRPLEAQGPSLHSLANIMHRSQLRCASTKVVQEGVEAPGDSVQHMPLFKRFWRWLHDLDDLERWDNPPDSQTQAELDEREEFLSRVQAMYFADPPKRPDLQFCRESLEMLMKYNDRVAVETLWNILPEMKVEPDEELKTRVLLYLKKAKLEAYYE